MAYIFFDFNLSTIEYPRYHCETTVHLPGLLLDMRLVSPQDLVQGTNASPLEAKKKKCLSEFKKMKEKKSYYKHLYLHYGQLN